VACLREVLSVAFQVRRHLSIVQRWLASAHFQGEVSQPDLVSRWIVWHEFHSAGSEVLHQAGSLNSRFTDWHAEQFFVFQVEGHEGVVYAEAVDGANRFRCHTRLGRGSCVTASNHRDQETEHPQQFPHLSH